MKYGKKIKSIKFYAMTLGFLLIAVLVQLMVQNLFK